MYKVTNCLRTKTGDLEVELENLEIGIPQIRCWAAIEMGDNFRAHWIISPRLTYGYLPEYRNMTEDQEFEQLQLAVEAVITAVEEGTLAVEEM